MPDGVHRGLDQEQVRTLRLLAEKPAHELVERPLKAPLFALAKGWAVHGPIYDSWVGNRRVKARTVLITEEGRAVLRAALAERGGQ